MTKQTPPQKPDERRAWIHYRMALAGYNFAKLAREYGLHRTCALVALYRRYPKFERIIAEKIGYLPEEIWPERYTQKQIIRRRRRKQ